MIAKSNSVTATNQEIKQKLENDVSLEPGIYVLAVSGGVDSIVLLDLLKNHHDLQLIVGHFDHGIRTDSGIDRQFIQSIAKQLGLPFVSGTAKLGSGASEASARTARYAFLEEVRQSHAARAIVTAHHQDDVLETALINILRGTNRKGLTALSNRPTILRPLLNVPKKDLLAYAKSHGLKWREDYTNEDETYLRNYIRRRLLPQFDSASRTRLLNIIENTRVINDKLDRQLIDLVKIHPNERELDRSWFISLPHKVGREFLATWLREREVGNFDSKTLERLVIGAKVSRAGSLINITGTLSLKVGKEHLALVG